MKVSVEMFLQQNPPQKLRSKLDAYHAAILELIKIGYTQAEILIFLQQNDVHVSQAYLSKYISSLRARQNNLSPSEQSPQAMPTTVISQANPSIQYGQKASVKEATSKQSTKDTNFGTFDWQKPIDVSELI